MPDRARRACPGTKLLVLSCNHAIVTADLLSVRTAGATTIALRP